MTLGRSAVVILLALGTFGCIGARSSLEIESTDAGVPAVDAAVDEGNVEDASIEQEAAATACVTQFGLGYDFSCGLWMDGEVRCWGGNLNGELGDGTITPHLQPTLVPGQTDALAISGGYRYECARRSDNSLWCWGENNHGQIGNSSIMPDVPAPAHIMDDVAAVATNTEHTCARLKDGSLWCWGRNDHGQLGGGGFGGDQQAPAQVQLAERALDVSVGGAHTCALTASGAWCWGWNGEGQLGVGSSIDQPVPVRVFGMDKTVVSIVAGGRHTCAMKQDGSLWCWGDNSDCQVGDGTNLPRWKPVQVTTLGTNVAAVVAGGTTTCARTKDGSAWCWGGNEFDEIGVNSSTGPVPIPVHPTGVGPVRDIFLRAAHVLAIGTDGRVWGWGADFNGQLGLGTKMWSRPTPVVIGTFCP